MKNFILLLMSCLLFHTCKEVYEPAVDKSSKSLVVDGLITDQPVAYKIRITHALPYDTSAFLPETGATVYVTDDAGNKFAFPEKTPGSYVSDPSYFLAITGRKYILTIETKNGAKYMSSEQELLPPDTSGNISFTGKEKSVVIYDGGNPMTYPLRGAQFISSHDVSSEKNPYYRFSNVALIEYLSISTSTSYCWKKYGINETFNINDRKYTSSYFQQDLGFCPFDTFFFNIRLLIEEVCCPRHTIYVDQYVEQYVLSFKEYHINKEIHDYYRKLNNQLESKQRILEPIAYQVGGNITCITNPEEKVFGIFEASSVHVTTLKMDPTLSISNYQFYPIPPMDLDTIADWGAEENVPPKFWIR